MLRRASWDAGGGSERRLRPWEAAGLSGIGWLTPVAEMLARAEEKQPSGKPPRSVIVLWLNGGPSQLETFDPHPGTEIAADSQARATSVKGIQVGRGLEQVAEQPAKPEPSAACVQSSDEKIALLQRIDKLPAIELRHAGCFARCTHSVA